MVEKDEKGQSERRSFAPRFRKGNTREVERPKKASGPVSN
jgi:hypothetical protein